MLKMKRGKKILLGNGLVSFSVWFFPFSSVMPTASKSGITGSDMIPLANTDETLCSGLSLLHAFPTKGFHRGDSRGGEKETFNDESKTVPSPVPAHRCHLHPSSTGCEPKLEDYRWEWKIFHPKVWAIARSMCHTDFWGIKMLHLEWVGTVQLLHLHALLHELW